MSPFITVLILMTLALSAFVWSPAVQPFRDRARERLSSLRNPESGSFDGAVPQLHERLVGYFHSTCIGLADGTRIAPEGLVVRVPSELHPQIRAVRAHLRRDLYRRARSEGVECSQTFQLRVDLDARLAADSWGFVCWYTGSPPPPSPEQDLDDLDLVDSDDAAPREIGPDAAVPAPTVPIPDRSALVTLATRVDPVDTFGLILILPDGSHRSCRGDVTLIGSSSDAGVVVEHDTVSRRHFWLRRVEEGYVAEVVDGATNGLRVDGVTAAVGMRLPVHDGSLLALSGSVSVGVLLEVGEKEQQT